MADFEVHLDLRGRTRPVGLVRRHRVRGAETVLFEYNRAWLEDPGRDTAKAAGARPADINRMASAFEHDDLTRALAL